MTEISFYDTIKQWQGGIRTVTIPSKIARWNDLTKGQRVKVVINPEKDLKRGKVLELTQRNIGHNIEVLVSQLERQEIELEYFRTQILKIVHEGFEWIK